MRQEVDKLEKELLSLKHTYLVARGGKSENAMDLDERTTISIDTDHFDRQGGNFTEYAHKLIFLIKSHFDIYFTSFYKLT